MNRSVLLALLFVAACAAPAPPVAATPFPVPAADSGPHPDPDPDAARDADPDTAPDPARDADPVTDPGNDPAAAARAEAALAAAKLGHLRLSATMTPTRDHDGAWRFALFEPGSCEGACKSFDEGEQVGWLRIDDTDVTIEALEQRWALAAFAAIRAREKALAERLPKLPALAAYCRHVVAQGADACTMWLEAAPPRTARRIAAGRPTSAPLAEACRAATSHSSLTSAAASSRSASSTARPCPWSPSEPPAASDGRTGLEHGQRATVW